MKSGLLFSTATSAIVGEGVIDETNIVPAVVRDLDYTRSGKDIDSLYLDRRDFLMESVEVDIGGVSFGTAT